MSEQEPAGTIIIPAGEKLTYKSELFDVIIRHKSVAQGLTRDRYMVAVELLEHDPLIDRTALIEIARDVWTELGLGERAKIRLYEQPDERWTTHLPARVA